MNKLKQSLSPESENTKVSAKRPLLILGLTVLAWFPLITLLNAWVITLFWRWFIVPQFGTAPLSLPIAAGFEIMFGFLTSRQNLLPASTESSKESIKELSWSERFAGRILPNFGLALLRAWLFLMFGLVVHLFVRH